MHILAGVNLQREAWNLNCLFFQFILLPWLQIVALGHNDIVALFHFELLHYASCSWCNLTVVLFFFSLCCPRSGGVTWRGTQRCGSSCSLSSAPSSATPTSSPSGKVHVLINCLPLAFKRFRFHNWYLTMYSTSQGTRGPSARGGGEA